MRSRKTFIFKSLFVLWAFVQTLNINYYEIDAQTNSLSCVCDDDDADRAVDDFDAVVIDSANFRS